METQFRLLIKANLFCFSAPKRFYSRMRSVKAVEAPPIQYFAVEVLINVNDALK